jgi:hypothetical protein
MVVRHCLFCRAPIADDEPAVGCHPRIENFAGGTVVRAHRRCFDLYTVPRAKPDDDVVASPTCCFCGKGFDEACESVEIVPLEGPLKDLYPLEVHDFEPVRFHFACFGAAVRRPVADA